MAKSKDVALVLSSGGPRGFAYIGAIRELESRGYDIKSVAGTSMGSLIGGIYAAGKLDEAEEWFLSLDAWKVFKMLDVRAGRNHMVKGDKIIESLERVVPDVKIEDLRIPYCAVATDLYLGEEVVFTEGSLFKAIRASISIPGLLCPVRYGNCTMVDGGLVNSIPLNRVVRHEGDILVAFNVNDIDKEKVREKIERSAELRQRKAARKGLINEAIDTVRHAEGSFIDKVKIAGHEGTEVLEEFRRDRDYEEIDLGGNYYSLLDRTFDLMNHRNTMLSIAATPPDVLVNMPFDAYGSIPDYAKVREISDRGRKLMAEALDEYEKR